MNNNKLVSFVKGSAILILSNIALKGINFLLLPVYTKYLTAAQLGVTDVITNLVSILLPFLVMGLDSAISAFYFDEETEEYHGRVFNTVFITLLIAAIVPFILTVFSGSISELLFHNKEYQWAVCISLVSVSINLWHLPFSLLIRIKNRMGVFAIVNITASLCMILSNVIFVAVLKTGAYALIISTGIVQLVQFTLYFCMVRKEIHFRLFNRKLLSRMLKYSLPLVPMVLANWILVLSDRMILLKYCGESEIGIYGIGVRFATIVSMIANGVFVAYTTYAFSSKDDDNAKKRYAKIMSMFFIVVVTICFTVSIFGKELVQLMTSDVGYLAAYRTLSFLLYSQLIYGLNTIVGYGAAFVKKAYFQTIAVWAGAVVNLGLNFIFIPKYGAVAAAATTLVGYCVMFSLSYFFSQRLYPCDYGIKKIAAISGFLLVLNIVALDFPPEIKLILTIICIALLLIIYRKLLREMLIFIKREIFRKGERIKDNG